MGKRILFGLTVIAFIAAVAVASLSMLPAASVAERIPGPTAEEPKTFTSYNDLVNYINQRSAQARRLSRYEYLPQADGLAVGSRVAVEESIAMKAAPAQEAPRDYSATNVQVEGVDEADLVKTDGTHLYVLSGNEVLILRAHPAEDARILSRTAFPGVPQDMFISGDSLLVIGGKSGTGGLLVHLYDAGDKEKPELKKAVELQGRCVTSRLIGDYAYTIANAPVYGAGKSGAKEVVLPKININGQALAVSAARVHYFDVPDYSYRYTIVLAVNVRDGNEPVTEKTFLTGVSQNVFVSQKHIFLTAGKMPDLEKQSGRFFERLLPAVPAGLRAEMVEIRDSGADFATKLSKAESVIDGYLNELDPAAAPALIDKVTASYEQWRQDLARERNMTVIHKLAVAGNEVTYLCKGEVPGRVLNQFSMDEYQGFFRTATTSEGFAFSGPWVNRNNVYVLDDEMRITGRLEGLAPGERIYAARFMGKRCYLVTFRQVDPLFVVDLEDPREPELLGELKIPGYSNYLHPYGEHHLIGIGKEVAAEPVPLPGIPEMEAAPPERVIVPTRETGIKIALFDVTDPARPKETAKYVIEGSGADSPALHDHKAVLFSKSKNLLAIPVSFYPVYRETGKMPLYRQWQGAYVFDVSLKGISLRGTVTHGPDRPGFQEHNFPVKRCLYIDDVLYSVSERMVKASDLNTLKEVSLVQW